MTDKNDTKNWHKNQDWIKDVLSKSGTELMEITATSKNGAGKKTSRKNGNKEIQQNKMVYYQSTPLIVKTEPPSQAQFCTPLATPGAAHNTAASSTLVPQQLHQLQSQHAPHKYSISNGAIILQQAPQSAATPTATSISNVHMQNFSSAAQNLNFLNNIKAELLPPSITVYSTSSNSNVSVPTLTSAHATLQASAPTASLPVSATPNAGGSSTTTSATAAGRKTAANKPQFKCEQCGMTFGSKSAHTSHTKSHAKNGDLAALNGLAGPSTSAAAAAAALELNEAGVPLGIPKTPQIKPNASGVPGSDPYQCNVCQKTFAVPARLIRHYRTHTGERPFECEFCHKLFSVKENLQVHRRIHTKERPYGCDVCGRAFEHSGKLHRHMRIHTGERPHKCAVCEKTFIQSGQLVIHMRTHTGEKPYKCPVEGCGKGFTCSKQLKVHSRTHTGEKPYHCDICFRDFGYNHVLKLHRVQHYGSKCYKCTICDETFKSKKEMEAHIKGHANEMPDDDDEAAVGASVSSGGQTSSTSTSGSGGETTSAPGSPQSPSNGVNTSASVRRPRKPKQRVTGIAALAPLSPSSPRSTLSPSSSMASASRLSAGSPASSIASPAMSIILETDQHSHDSGVASTSNNRQLCESGAAAANATASTMLGMHNPSAYCLEELPTDLSVQQQQQHQQQQSPTTAHYYQQQPHQQQKPQANNNSVYQQQSQSQSQSSYNYMRHSPVPLAAASPLAMLFDQQQSPQHYQQGGLEAPTINPALLEAASIASRHALLEPREEDVTAALQIMQLTRTHKPTQQQQQQPHLNSPQLQAIQHPTPTASPNYITTQQQRPLLISDLANYDDTHEANELIEHYKRGDLARHGIHKGYAPVPKFEPALPNNENLVRQVEAALAPLRSSTESPERSSSPESDSMMMADRDVMTLPLRKRKLYMNEGPNETPKPDSQANNSGGLDATGNNNSGNINGVGINADLGNKVMRMNSVIQFAKAS